MRTLHIQIADSQYLTREGLKAILKQYTGFKVISETTDKHETFYQLKKMQPDILILDFNNLDDFHPEDMALLSSISSNVKVLIIADISDAQIVKQVMAQHVSGFLTKTCEKAEILDTLYALGRGEKMYCHKVLEMILEAENAEGLDCAGSILSDREVEIIQLVASGLTTRQIAETLFRSYHTISTHRKNIMKKLQLKTTRELMLYAIQSGMVQTNATTALNN